MSSCSGYSAVDTVAPVTLELELWLQFNTLEIFTLFLVYFPHYTAVLLPFGAAMLAFSEHSWVAGRPCNMTLLQGAPRHHYVQNKCV